MRQSIYFSLLIFISPITATEAKQSDVIGFLSSQPLIMESKLDLTLRNYGKYLNEDETGEKLIHSAWGQAFNFDYQSGYLNDFIGLDASFITVAKLAASDYFHTRSLLWNDDGDARGFNKLSQRYAKVKLGSDNNLKFNGKAGWHILKNFGVLTASHQLTQNSFLGYSGTLAYEPFSIDAFYVTRSMNRDSPKKTKFHTADKKDIDYIAALGLNYNSKELSLEYAFGEAESYIQRHMIEAKYQLHPQLILSSQIYANMPLSKYNELPKHLKATDGNAWHYAIDAKWQQGALGIKLMGAYTKAHKDDGSLGYFQRHLTRNARWRFNALTSAAYHYQRDKELGITALTDYKYSAQFYNALQINYGQFNYRNNNFKTGEVSIINVWTPSHPSLKNLSIFTKFGKSWAYKSNKSTAQPYFYSDGNYQRATGISGEVIINYKLNLL